MPPGVPLVSPPQEGPDVQYNHVFRDPRNPATYSALWNICVTPAFLAKTTDGSNHPEGLAALRFRVLELYGCSSSTGAGRSVRSGPASHRATGRSPGWSHRLRSPTSRPS
jgi:hypothetical protein